MKMLWVIELWYQMGGRRRKRRWVFVVGLVLCVLLSPNNLHQFKQRRSHKGILRSYFLFLYLSAITWLYCNLLVMIIELVFHKTFHMLFTLISIHWVQNYIFVNVWKIWYSISLSTDSAHVKTDLQGAICR